MCGKPQNKHEGSNFKKKSLKRLKYYIRKYALNAKQSSKGGKEQQKYKTYGKQKVRWQT